MFRAIVAISVVLTFLAGAGAHAQTMQGKWQYLLKTTDGIATGIVEIDSRNGARASGKVSGIAYTQSGSASQQGANVDIQFNEARVPGTSMRYSPDHLVCHFASANILDCTMTDQKGSGQGTGQMAREGTQDAATLGQKPASVQGNYYTDRRTGCRLWTPSFHQDATVQWTGGCQGGVADGPGVLTLTHSVANESGDVEVRIEGRYSAGKLNGRALVTYDNGARFEGEMKDGVRHGHGRYTVPGKGYYDGDYRDGAWWGHGVRVFDKDCSTCDLPGARYEGEFVNFKFQGAGIFTKANGEKYEGAWGNNLPNGPGTYSWDNGRQKYSGKWASGCSLSPQNQLYSFPDPNVHSCDVMIDYLRQYTNR
ncbi:MAG TPA: hypothetical protein VKY24_11715 [Reyranella sp.]|nr:hypothetical protein [Reyranella sp.]